MTLRGMLGAVKAARSRRRDSSEVSETSSLDGTRSEAAGDDIGADVPDLGSLMFLGTDRRGREVAEAVNLHWRAYAKQV